MFCSAAYYLRIRFRFRRGTFWWDTPLKRYFQFLFSAFIFRGVLASQEFLLCFFDLESVSTENI